MDNLLTITQAAEIRGKPRQLIHYWIKHCGLPVVKIAGKTFINCEVLLAFAPPKPGPKGKGK